MKKKSIFLSAVIAAICLMAVLFVIFYPQIAHLRVSLEERQRQTVLDEKLQSLTTSVAIDVRDNDPNVLRSAREIREFICHTWSNREDRVRALLKMEGSLYDIDTAKLLSTKGHTPIWRVYELVGEIMNGFSGMENSRVEVWKMKIRALARVRRELDLARKLSAVEPAQSDKKKCLEDWIKNIKSTNDFWLRNHERHFNSDVKWKDLSKDQELEIRAYFEHYLGRPIRTNAQIHEDFERDYREHTPYDDDVRIDIDF